MKRGQIFQPKNFDDGCRTQIVDVIGDHNVVIIHTDEGCTVTLLHDMAIEKYMKPGDKIECVCGEMF